MLAGNVPTLRIDLNLLRGDRIVTRLDFVHGGNSVLPSLGKGDVVRVVEEEGDTYLAVVERVQGLRVYLRLYLDSWVLARGTVEEYSVSYSGALEPEVPEVLSAPPTVAFPIPA